MRFIVLSTLLFAVSPVLSQDKEVATSQYEKDVVALHGSIAAYRDLVVSCAEMYPQTLRLNRAAYEQWHYRYLALHQEVERRFAAIIREKAGDDRNRQVALILQFHDAFERQRQRSRRDMLAKEESESRGSCTGYPLFMRSEKADFEQRFPERVSSMRSRPE